MEFDDRPALSRFADQLTNAVEDVRKEQRRTNQLLSEILRALGTTAPSEVETTASDARPRQIIVHTEQHREGDVVTIARLDETHQPDEFFRARVERHPGVDGVDRYVAVFSGLPAGNYRVTQIGSTSLMSSSLWRMLTLHEGSVAEHYHSP